MAFFGYGAKNVGTSAATLRTVPASTVATVIGAGFSNTSVVSVNVSVYITRSAVDYYLIKDAPVAPGNSLVVIGGDQKVVMNSGDVFKVVASVANAGDAWMSDLEVAQ